MNVKCKWRIAISQLAKQNSTKKTELKKKSGLATKVNTGDGSEPEGPGLGAIGATSVAAPAEGAERTMEEREEDNKWRLLLAERAAALTTPEEELGHAVKQKLRRCDTNKKIEKKKNFQRNYETTTLRHYDTTTLHWGLRGRRSPVERA
eukprot:4234169-Pyramimonas_sp.AAC.1